MVSDANLREIERRRLEEAEAESAEIDRTPVRTYWQLVRQRFVKHRLAVIAVVVLIILAAYAIIVPTLTGDAWTKTQLFRDDAPPEIFNEDGEFVFAILGYDPHTQHAGRGPLEALGAGLEWRLHMWGLRFAARTGQSCARTSRRTSTRAAPR